MRNTSDLLNEITACMHLCFLHMVDGWCRNRQLTVKSVLKSNTQLLSQRDYHTVRTLLNRNQTYVFKNWPAPGDIHDHMHVHGVHITDYVTCVLALPA